MKKLGFYIWMLLLVCSVSTVQAKKKGGTAYGVKFETKSAIAPESLSKNMGEKSELHDVVVSGEIVQVCQAEGCWMKLSNKSGAPIMVKFKDHAFLVPKNIAGKSAVVYGTAVKKTVSVAEQKHLAEDAGSTQEVIDAITQPKEELLIEATGVVVNS